LDAGEGKHRAGGLVGLRVPLPRVETDEDDPARLVRGLHVVVTNEDGGLVGLELEGVGADDVEGRRIEAGRAGELGERLAGQALRATGKRRVEVGERVRPDVGRVGAAAIEGIVDADLAQKDVPLIVLDRRVPADAAVADLHVAPLDSTIGLAAALADAYGIVLAPRVVAVDETVFVVVLAVVADLDPDAFLALGAMPAGDALAILVTGLRFLVAFLALLDDAVSADRLASAAAAAVATAGDEKESKEEPQNDDSHLHRHSVSQEPSTGTQTDRVTPSAPGFLVHPNPFGQPSVPHETAQCPCQHTPPSPQWESVSQLWQWGEPGRRAGWQVPSRHRWQGGQSSVNLQASISFKQTPTETRHRSSGPQSRSEVQPGRQ